MLIRTLTLLLLLPLWGFPEAAESPATAPAFPVVQSLGRGQFQIGQVILNKNTRSVRFPAVVNMRDATIEYVVVHRAGKAHESIFTTAVRPQDVHLAFLLLGGKPSLINQFGTDGRGQPPGEKVWGDALWTNGQRQIRRPLEDLVQDKHTQQPLRRGPWIYNGSNFSEGQFTAERDGSIISTHIDPDALVNNPRPGRENDDLYQPDESALPPLGTPVTIELFLTSSH